MAGTLGVRGLSAAKACVLDFRYANGRVLRRRGLTVSALSPAKIRDERARPAAHTRPAAHLAGGPLIAPCVTEAARTSLQPGENDPVGRRVVDREVDHLGRLHHVLVAR